MSNGVRRRVEEDGGGRQEEGRRPRTRALAAATRACAVRSLIVPNMAASVIPSKVREKWRFVRALDGAIVDVRAREQCRASVCRVQRDVPWDDATCGCAASYRHGAGHGATFPERVQFPAELGESCPSPSWQFVDTCVSLARSLRA